MRDARRDAATRAVPLRAERRVWRYTSKREAARELRNGVPAGAHMTSEGRAGPAAERCDGAAPVRAAKGSRGTDENTPRSQYAGQAQQGLGGEPGRGEVTSTQAVGKEQIEKVTPLH